MAATTKNYIIPLRKSFQQSAPLKRTPKALRTVKAYLIKHCKVEEVKIGARLNDLLWAKGITNPPHKVSVTVIVEDGIAKAELEGHTYAETKAIQKKTEPQSMKEKLVEKIGAPVKKEAAAEEKPAEKPAKEDKPVEKAPAAKKEDAPKQ